MATTRFNKWLHGLGSAVITAACTGGMASLGITAANLTGVSIPPLNLKQLGMVLVGGGIVGAIAYLKQSPLPPEEGDEKSNNSETKN